MTKKIVNKWIGDNEIKGANIRLANNEMLRARNATNTSDVDILKVSGSDVIMQSLFKTPSTKPESDYQAANKKYVDDKILSTKIADLSDVTLSSKISGQSLVWNGSEWVNSKAKLSQLGDVVISSPTNGQVLAFDGTQWKNAAAGGTFGYVCSFRVASGTSIASRCIKTSTGIPDGIKILAGSQDPTKKHRLGSSPLDLIISHDRGNFLYDIKVMEWDTTGPLTTQYANIIDMTPTDVIRNNISDVGSGVGGPTGAFRILDMKSRIQNDNRMIFVLKFLS